MLGDSSCKLALLVLGFLYPAYKTFKVVQLPATRSNDTLLRHWCQYWALMAVFVAAQPLADTFCFWLPLYYEAKLVAAVYLWANELAGAQHVWQRWAQPAVSRYEPQVDRWLAESKALARDWLHSNALRLLALAQQRFFAWLAQVQQHSGGGGAPPARGRSARRAPSSSRRAQRSASEDESLEEEEEEEDATPSPEPAPRRRKGKGKGKATEGGAAPEPPARFSSFSLASFYSARSADLQAADVKAGLKAFPIVADARDE